MRGFNFLFENEILNSVGLQQRNDSFCHFVVVRSVHILDGQVEDLIVYFGRRNEGVKAVGWIVVEPEEDWSISGFRAIALPHQETQ